MATDEDGMTDLSDEDVFEFKPTSVSDVNCWGSNFLNDLEITSSIKEVISPVAENTNLVNELPCAAVIKTEDSEGEVYPESATTSAAVETNAELNISDEFLVSTEENGETDPNFAGAADMSSGKNLDAESAMEEIVCKEEVVDKGDLIETKAALSISDGLLVSTEENGETEPNFAGVADVNSGENLDAERAVEEIVCKEEIIELQQLDEVAVCDNVSESVKRNRPGPKSKKIKLENSDEEYVENANKINLNIHNTSDRDVNCTSGSREDQNESRQLDEAVAVLGSAERRRPGPKSQTYKLENATIDSGVKNSSKESQNEVQQLSETVIGEKLVENVERRRPGPKSKTNILKNAKLDNGIQSSSKLKEAQNEIQKLSETTIYDKLVDSVERRRPGPKSKTNSYCPDKSASGAKGSSEIKEAQSEVQQLSKTIICDQIVERRRPGPKSKTNICSPNESAMTSEMKEAQNEVQQLSGTIICDELVEGVERRRPGPKSKTKIFKNGGNVDERNKEENKLSEKHIVETCIYNPNASEKQNERSRPGPKTCNWKNSENDNSTKKKRKIISQEFVDDSDSDHSNTEASGIKSSNKVKVKINEFQQLSKTTDCDTLLEKVERRRPGPKSKTSIYKKDEDADEAKQKKRKVSGQKYAEETHFNSPTTSKRMVDDVRSSSGKGIKYMPPNIETPLHLGWKREIVHRATYSDKKRMSDVYYNSPKGKKLRSMNEVEQYLHLMGDTSVKLDMFSYYKQKLTNHENESERYAKKSEKKVSAEGLSSQTPEEKNHPKATCTEVPHRHNKTEGKKRKKKSFSFNSSNNDTIEDLNPICNGFCEGYLGQLPDMNCVSCFCLFHPKCVGIFSSDEASDFICKNCLHKQSSETVPNNESAKNHHSNVSEIKLQKLKIKSPHKTMEPHSSQESQNSHTSSSAGSWKKKMKTDEHSVTSSPPKSINIVPIPFLSPSSQVPTVSNISPSRARVLPSSVHSISAISAIAKKTSDQEVIDLEPITDFAPLEIKENDSNDYNCWTCNLPKEADALANVFNYLHTKDLFKVKLVCSSWNAIASRPFLWNHLYLQGLLVTDWNLLADFIEAKNVVMLNMRGMKMTKDIGEMWKQFNSILPRLSNINELMLCKIPASIPYRLATKLPHLTHFASEEIFDSKVDPNRGCKLFMGKFNKLTELRRLKLNGFKGLFIPKSVISDEFLNTDALKNLRHLSLTTFTGTKPSQLESLTLLPDLTILELGNCSDWTDEHFLRIGLLSKLKKLRLEFGGTKESPVLCEVLQKLTELQTLELVLFNIPDNFIQVLACLKQLQLLTVWPNEENGAANSYRLTKALKTMSRLKKFVWGLVASELVREASMQKKMDDKVRCIPHFTENNVGQEKAKWSEEKICANDLMERLRVILPSTIIRVVIVSSKSYSSIRQASASK